MLLIRLFWMNCFLRIATHQKRRFFIFKRQKFFVEKWKPLLTEKVLLHFLVVKRITTHDFRKIWCFLYFLFFDTKKNNFKFCLASEIIFGFSVLFFTTRLNLNEEKNLSVLFFDWTFFPFQTSDKSEISILNRPC